MWQLEYLRGEMELRCVIIILRVIGVQTWREGERFKVEGKKHQLTQL